MKTEKFKILEELVEEINDYFFDANVDNFDIPEDKVVAQIDYYKQYFENRADVDSEGSNKEAKIWALIIKYLTFKN